MTASGKRKTGILEGYAKCLTHTLAMQSWNDYDKNKKLGKSIYNHFDSTRNRKIYSNRHYLKSVAETPHLTGRLEITLRGHDESESSLNKGNFLDIFSIIAKHDPIVQKRIDKGPKMPLTYLQTFRIRY